jgi:hypothetical protein
MTIYLHFSRGENTIVELKSVPILKLIFIFEDFREAGKIYIQYQPVPIFDLKIMGCSFDWLSNGSHDETLNEVIFIVYSGLRSSIQKISPFL